MNNSLKKRFVDLFLVILFSPILLTVGVLVCVLVKAKIGSPVFFRQTRPGLNGVPFEMIKFRTMSNEKDINGVLLSNEKRLSRFGRALRSTSLDELPEFLNVLKGDMSLVGPRPLLMEYLPRYSVEQRRRHNVKPGITGWAQINGRNAIDWPEKFLLDVWYVNNQSILLDLKIMLLTIKKVFRRDGINSSDKVTMKPFLGETNDGRKE